MVYINKKQLFHLIYEISLWKLSDINIAITKESIEENDIPHINNSNKFKDKINIIAIPTILTVPIYSKEIHNSFKKIEENARRI